MFQHYSIFNIYFKFIVGTTFFIKKNYKIKCQGFASSSIKGFSDSIPLSRWAAAALVVLLSDLGKICGREDGALKHLEFASQELWTRISEMVSVSIIQSRSFSRLGYVSRKVKLIGKYGIFLDGCLLISSILPLKNFDFIVC